MQPPALPPKLFAQQTAIVGEINGAGVRPPFIDKRRRQSAAINSAGGSGFGNDTAFDIPNRGDGWGWGVPPPPFLLLGPRMAELHHFPIRNKEVESSGRGD